NNNISGQPRRHTAKVSATLNNHKNKLEGINIKFKNQLAVSIDFICHDENDVQYGLANFTVNQAY
ncbi:MAG: hypothetical protein WCJ62_06930, partial [Flavobacterium sp.]